MCRRRALAQGPWRCHAGRGGAAFRLFFPNERPNHGSAGFEISVGQMRRFDDAAAAGGAGGFETSAGSTLLRGVFRCASDAMACAAAGAGEADAPSFCWVTDPLAADVSAGVA